MLLLAVAAAALAGLAGAERLDNGRVWAEFDPAHPRVSGLGVAGGPNVLADSPEADPLRLHRGGVVVERDGGEPGFQEPFWVRTTASSRAGPAEGAGPGRWVAEDDLTRATFALRLDGDALELDVAVEALRDAEGVQGLRLAAYFAADLPGLVAEFDEGVEQMLDSPASFWAAPAGASLRRAWASGRAGAVMATPDAPGTAAVLRSRVQGLGAASGLQLWWTPARVAPACAGEWVDDLSWTYVDMCNRTSVGVLAGQTWRARLRLRPSAAPAPVPLRANDADALAAAFTSAAGALNTLRFPGMAHPTLAHPQQDSYAGDFNFFDPDCFFVVGSLLLAGDAGLAAQARAVLEASGAAMLPSGQVPHHFSCNSSSSSSNQCTPVFEALSGAVQTGPNAFWASAALRYAALADDGADFLEQWWPAVRRAVDFLLDMRDPHVGLLRVQGPLWIDTLIRDEFASDTNAFAVLLLRQVAAAERRWRRDGAAAAELERVADGVAAAMNARLWAGDHYVTQVDANGTVRDFVDYDSNLLAVAAGVARGERAAAVLRRVQGGKCGGAFPTFVSERTYTAPDCYLGNTGDSAVSLGRIGWAHALALRAARGDVQALLAPLREEFRRLLWMHERYTCDGRPVHNPFFVEFPEVLAVATREAVLGVELTVGRALVQPSDVHARFEHAAAGLRVERDGRRRTRVRVPPTVAVVDYVIDATPGAWYVVAPGGARVQATEEGFVEVEGGVEVEVTASSGGW